MAKQVTDEESKGVISFEPPDGETVSEFLDRCRKEFSEDYELDRLDREEAQADNSFANSSDASKSQWNTEAYEQRKAALRPILQWNRLPTYIQHVANAGRQNKPEIKTSAGDNGTDEAAQFYEGRIRQTLYECKADIVRDTMRDQQITSGRAFGRVTTEYIPGTTKQRPVVKRIENQFSVIFGPGREYDRSDSDRCWVITQITKAEHKRLYGKNSLLNQTNFATRFDGWESWIGLGKTADMIQIAEKFEKEYGAEDPETRERTWKVCRYVINGAEILDKEYAITNDIGIVPQWGREAVVDAIQRHFSLVNAAKDPQRLVNLYVSNIAQEIANIPKDRFEAPIGSIPKNMEDSYKSNSPNAIRYYLQYDEQDRQLNKPESGTREAPIEALTVGLQQAIEGIKAAMGIYDASMGQRSNETSGIAINRRKVEGETINYHFIGNEARTWDRIGQILIKMIDVLDKGKTKLPVRHENGKTEMIPIGSPYQHPKSGREVTIKLDAAAYGVRVEQGLSYANAMEQKEERDQALIQAQPELMFTGIGVSMIRNSQYPGADEDADSLERFINMKTPGLIPDEQQGEAPIPPAVQQKLQFLQQDNQKAHAFAQSLHEQLATKAPEIQANMQKAQLDNEIKKYTVDEQEKTKRTLGLAAINSTEGLAKLESELNIVHSKLDRTHELMMKVLDQKHATDTQQAGQAHEADQANQNREAAAEQAQVEA